VHTFCGKPVLRGQYLRSLPMDKSNAADKYVNVKAHVFMYVMLTDVNLSYPLYRPGQTLALQAVEASRIPR